MGGATAVYGGPYLDRSNTSTTAQTPPQSWAAAESGEIDATYQTTGNFIGHLRLARLDPVGGGDGRHPCRSLQPLAEPYTSRDVRNALQMAVDNNVVLELGYNNRGVVAENHHVCPIHPEYADVGMEPLDRAAAKAALDAAGLATSSSSLYRSTTPGEAATCDAAPRRCGTPAST
jgi:peptide/nickel transport system substrate-binding protein